MDIDKAIQVLEASDDYRVLKRLQVVDQYNAEDGSDKRIGIYLDVETTGMNADDDVVIELAMVPFEFNKAGQIFRVLEPYNAFQDPGCAIPAEITRITGITDEMVKGQSIDHEKISKMLSEAVIVIAHNAKFDRAFCENLDDAFKDISWACSISDINWNEEGMEGVKLEYLAYKYGFFYEGHRATIDCYAALEILSRPLPVSGELALKRLLDTARKATVRLWAVNAPFDKKDDLKARRYRWSDGSNGSTKAWYIDVSEDDYDDELVYLKDNIYPGNLPELPSLKITAKERYSAQSVK